ncbi:MAG: creatininase family protein [Paracoccaceae bacterium]
MRLELMRPGGIRDAIATDLPLVLPLGVLEYHGEHLPCGMDMLAVARILDRIEAAHPDRVILAPAFPYGAASFAVAGPEGTGTLQVGPEALVPFAEALFAGLLRIGFRNIHAIIHHQTENFVQGMPTDLSFRLAARKAIFAHLERTRGEGWWGAAGMAAYYDDHAKGANQFNWVRVHPLMDEAIIAAHPFDHAGPGETALMLALAPETVEMASVAEGGHWYTEGAGSATSDMGERAVALIEARLRAILGL